MATPGISAPITGRVKLSDTFLEAHRTIQATVIDCELLTPTEAFASVRTAARGNNSHFIARGVKILGDRPDNGQGVDQAAAFGDINGCLRDDHRAHPITDGYNTRQLYPERYRYIRPYLTTARGIILSA